MQGYHCVHGPKSRDITLPTKVCLVKVMVFPVVMYGCESWTVKKAEHRRIDAFELWCWRECLEWIVVSWESLGLQRDPTSPFWRRSGLGFLWKEWCWSWNSNPLATSCDELTHWKRPCCWERLKAGVEGEDRGWDHWMASPTQWTWVWTNSRRWRGTSLACCSPWGRKESDTTEQLNWTEVTARTLQNNIYRA